MSKESIVEIAVEENILKLNVDTNHDGESVVDLELNVTEGIQELIQRGGKVEDVNLVSFEFVGTKMKLVVDTDQDGENLLNISIDLMEAVDEIKGKFTA